MGAKRVSRSVSTFLSYSRDSLLNSHMGLLSAIMMFDFRDTIHKLLLNIHRLHILLSNSSFSIFLGPTKKKKLDWETRLQIALGAAQGLAYLHHDCSPRIIHRDVKSSNILLDKDFEAHLTDFGIAKVLCSSKSHTSTYIMGTIGYIDPEYARTSRLTEKSDVYSYGIVLLELLTGRKAVDNESNLHHLVNQSLLVSTWTFVSIEFHLAWEIFYARRQMIVNRTWDGLPLHITNFFISGDLNFELQLAIWELFDLLYDFGFDQSHVLFLALDLIQNNQQCCDGNCWSWYHCHL